jgi:hypothetical protein
MYKKHIKLAPRNTSVKILKTLLIAVTKQTSTLQERRYVLAMSLYLITAILYMCKNVSEIFNRSKCHKQLRLQHITANASISCLLFGNMLVLELDYLHQL